MPFYQEYYRKNTLEVQENTTVVSSKSTYLLNEVSFLSYQAFTISPPPQFSVWPKFVFFRVQNTGITGGHIFQMQIPRLCLWTTKSECLEARDSTFIYLFFFKSFGNFTW